MGRIGGLPMYVLTVIAAAFLGGAGKDIWDFGKETAKPWISSGYVWVSTKIKNVEVAPVSSNGVIAQGAPPLPQSSALPLELPSALPVKTRKYIGSEVLAAIAVDQMLTRTLFTR